MPQRSDDDQATRRAETAESVTDTTLGTATDATARPGRRKPGPKPGSEAARRGGLAARAKYGPELYRRIGTVGGRTVRERHGSAFFSAIGKCGGEETKRTHGREHYARIGKIGGGRRKRGASHAHPRPAEHAEPDVRAGPPTRRCPAHGVPPRFRGAAPATTMD
jgi:general stress protein YciG